MKCEPRLTLADKICIVFDQALKTLTGHAASTGQAYPGETIPEADLTDAERKHAAGLMRVNHTGEICAQGLYQGQAMVCRSKALSEQLKQAAQEEGDHLNWCQTRLLELGSHTSYLNPAWYSASVMIGMVAGLAGDQWSLGFIAETERQVIIHLAKHQSYLPIQDLRSKRILEQMELEEAGHQKEAEQRGAKTLAQGIRLLMSLSSKVMVKTTYWV